MQTETWAGGWRQLRHRQRQANTQLPARRPVNDSLVLCMNTATSHYHTVPLGANMDMTDISISWLVVRSIAIARVFCRQDLRRYLRFAPMYRNGLELLI